MPTAFGPNRHASRSKGRPDTGQASVEFALVLPLLILLALGLLQAVVLGMDAARVNGAAREAARAAAVGRDAAGVRDAAVRGGGGLDQERLEVSVEPLPVTSGQPVTVEVGYRTQLFVPGVERLGLEAPVVRSKATMLAE